LVDLSARAERLDEYLAARDLEAVWFVRPNGFAWLTGGSNVVDRSASVGVAAAGYDGDVEFRADRHQRSRTRRNPPATDCTFK
jgi:hypothetical protein